MRITTITRAFNVGVRGTDFERLHLHSLRHCHASQLIAAGVNIKTVAERLGHASIVVTLDTYAHLLPGMDAAAAEAVDATLIS